MGYVLSLVCLIYSQFLHGRNEGFEFKMVHRQQNDFFYFNTCTLHLFLFFIITNKCTINIIKVYITTVSLCNLYSYMFRHFCIIIREFTAIALLSNSCNLKNVCYLARHQL